jgi:hypothetical protein
MTVDILPDSRARDIKGRIFRCGVPWVPVACASCHKPYGTVPEDMPFAFVLCNPCADRYGDIAGMAKMPDEVFFEKLKQEQMASYGRFLTLEEIGKVVEDNDSQLATLILKG